MKVSMKIYPSFLCGALWALILLQAELSLGWFTLIAALSLAVVGVISIRFDK